MHILAVTLIGACCVISSSHACATEDAQLMVAARVNYARAIEARCEALAPGHKAKLEAAYVKAKSNILLPMGVTDRVLAEAEASPELNSQQLLAKFDKRETAQQLQSCNQSLSYLVEAGQAVREPSQRR